MIVLLNMATGLGIQTKEQSTMQFFNKYSAHLLGEQGKGSDIDILVEFDKPVGMFKFLELEEYLSKKLVRKVNLVTKKALKKRIGKCS